MSNRALFARYEELKAEIKEAEKQLDILKPEILALIPEGSDVQGEYGVFRMQPRATWRYSPELNADKVKIKEREEAEKAKGVAKATYTPILFYVVKGE